MTIHTANTEKFLYKVLPDTIEQLQKEVSEDGVTDVYKDYRGELSAVMGNVDEPDQSDFDWRVAYDSIDRLNGDHGMKRRAVAAIAAKATVLTAKGPLRLYGEGGTFVVISADKGVLLAADNIPSPFVPKGYGCGDPYAFDKPVQAAIADTLVHQGAERGEGYEIISDIQRRLGILKAGKTLHIGMATLYEVANTAGEAKRNNKASAFAATTGRVLDDRARDEINQYYPDIATKMVDGVAYPKHSDDIAGRLDSISSMVAAKAAVLGITPNGHIVDMPNPLDPDERNVDWN